MVQNLPLTEKYELNKFPHLHWYLEQVIVGPHLVPSAVREIMVLPYFQDLRGIWDCFFLQKGHSGLFKLNNIVIFS